MSWRAQYNEAGWNEAGWRPCSTPPTTAATGVNRGPPALPPAAVKSPHIVTDVRLVKPPPPDHPSAWQPPLVPSREPARELLPPPPVQDDGSGWRARIDAIGVEFESKMGAKLGAMLEAMEAKLEAKLEGKLEAKLEVKLEVRPAAFSIATTPPSCSSQASWSVVGSVGELETKSKLEAIEAKMEAKLEAKFKAKLEDIEHKLGAIEAKLQTLSQ